METRLKAGHCQRPRTLTAENTSKPGLPCSPFCPLSPGRPCNMQAGLIMKLNDEIFSKTIFYLIGR